MAKYCKAKNGPALYLDCLECEDKVCQKQTIRVIIAGTRTFTDYRRMLLVLSKALGHTPRDQLEIISGGARGTDALAKEFAKRNHLAYTEFPANWDMLKKKAGPIRNKQMAEYASQLPDSMLIAFWDGKSPGTKNMIEEAKKAHLQIQIQRI